jgi:adenine-specific DNA-methyltransferase
MLTATYEFYDLLDAQHGPGSGFLYKAPGRGSRGGIVSHITSSSIANDEPADVDILVDRPEVKSGVTRVTGPFCVEATIPTSLEEESEDGQGDGTFVERLLDVLRRNPVLQLAGNRSMTLSELRVPSKSLTLSAEATFEDDPIALVFGPENGAVSERLVYDGAREAHARSYSQVLIIGFAIEAAAREFVQKCADLVGIPAIYVQATPDLVMGDLLKTMRSSQIFSVSGLPDVVVRKATGSGDASAFEVELLGLDVFDPSTMSVDHRDGSDVPAWLLDTDYNDLCFHVSQAFFPRTSAWESMKRALKGAYDESVWQHLAGTTSTPFEAGDHRQVAIKVIDDRGNELMVVKSLGEAM